MTEILTEPTASRSDPLVTGLAGAPPPPQGTTTGPGGTGRSRWGRLFLGPADDPAWARPGLWILLVVTAAIYLWDLSASGYANDYYAAAVKSGTESWKAWLFGSVDSANSITVDKPPASQWVMVASTRIFGFSSFAMLAPQALMGVGTVAFVYAAVKRWSGPAAALLAGSLMALTPVAVLMFRYNNPDALLVLLLTAAAYCVVRAVDTPAVDTPATGARVGRSALRWLLLAGVAVGFAFLTKMLQGLLLLPAFVLVYLVAGQARFRTRLWHLAAAAMAVVVSGGWFVAMVAIWPADSRPYIGGSQTNSLWELAIGYNGLSRIFGNTGSGTARAATDGAGGGFGGAGGGFGGTTGLGRMFNSSFGTEISWLIPAALIGLVAGLWFTRSLARTHSGRAGLLLWGTSMLVTAGVFSFMSGTVHAYYAVALAPAIAALVAISARELWRERATTLSRVVLALMIAATGVWSFVLLGRDVSWLPWLRWLVLVGAIVGAVLLTLSSARLRRFAVVGLVVGAVAASGGANAYAAATVVTPHTGAIPAAGPAGAGGDGFPGGGQLPPGMSQPDAEAGNPTRTGRQGPGGVATIGSELVNKLNATTTRWSAATVGAQTAAGYVLATTTAVMAIGGFSGSDPSPTLQQFQQYVADGQISYFISGGGFGAGGAGDFGGRAGGPGGDSGSGSQIQTWVAANFSSSTVGGVTVYDLTTG